MSNNYKEINMNLISVMEQEAKKAFDNGNEEDGRALLDSIFRQIVPALVEETKKNPMALGKLIVQRNSKDKKLAEQAQYILTILKNNGVNL